MTDAIWLGKQPVLLPLASLNVVSVTGGKSMVLVTPVPTAEDIVAAVAAEAAAKEAREKEAKAKAEAKAKEAPAKEAPAQEAPAQEDKEVKE